MDNYSNDNQELLNSDSLPLRNRHNTDLLCFYFSIPIFLATVLLFLFIFIKGKHFSFLHPKTSSGLYCGFNNSKIQKKFQDFSLYPFLFAENSSICIKNCNGRVFLSTCFPNDNRKLKNPSFSTQRKADFLSYYSFALSLSILLLFLSFPIYAFFLVFSASIFYVFLIVILVTLGYYFFYHIYYRNDKIAIFIGIFIIIFSLLSSFIYKRIHLISPLMTNSFKILQKSRFFFLIPFILFLSDFFLILFSILGISFTHGIGTPKVNIYNHIYLETPQANTITESLFILISFWAIQFMTMWMRCAISFIISSGYFHDEIPSLFNALYIIIKNHFGTLAFGSFTVCVLEGGAFFVNYIQRLNKKTKNCIVRSICKCLLCILYLIVKFASQVNKISFIYTGIKGTSFWDGCKESSRFLTNSNVFSVELILHQILFSVRITITSGIFTLSFYYLNKLNLFLPIIPMILIPLFSYFELGIVENIISSSCETNLVCFLDIQTSGAKSCFIPQDLWNSFGWIKEQYYSA